MKSLSFWGKFTVITILAISLLVGCQNTVDTSSSTTTEGTSSTEALETTTVTVTTEATNEALISSAEKVIWGQQQGTANEDLGTAIAVDASGNSCAVGFTSGAVTGDNLGSNDVLISYFDVTGENSWTIQTGTAQTDIATSVVFDKASDLYVTGTTTGNFGPEAGVGEIFIQKISKDGKIQWTKQYGGQPHATSTHITLDSEGNLFICGSTNGALQGPGKGRSDAYVMKLDASGNVLWTSQWGTELADEATGLAMDQEGNLYVIGSTEGTLGTEALGRKDVFYSQLSATGEIRNSYQYGTALDEYATKIVVDQDQNVFLAGWTNGELVAPKQGKGDSILIKADVNGTVLWQKQFGTALWDGIHGIILDKTNPTRVIVGGCSNYDNCQAFIINYDTDGNVVWNKTLIPEFSTCGREIAMDDQGNLYQTGGTHGQLYGTAAFEGPESDIFIYKISAND